METDRAEPRSSHVSAALPFQGPPRAAGHPPGPHTYPGRPRGDAEGGVECGRARGRPGSFAQHAPLSLLRDLAPAGPQPRRAADGSSLVCPWQTPALDTSHLLRSCVQSAVGLLQDPSERSQRNMRRVEILLGLLSEDDAHKGEVPGVPTGPLGLLGAWSPRGPRGRGGSAGSRHAANTCALCCVAAAFSREAKRRLHDLLRTQESFVVAGEQWVQEEAWNPDALQEAGTFRYLTRAARTCPVPAGGGAPDRAFSE